MADDRHLIVAGLHLFRHKKAPSLRRDTKHRQQLCGSPDATNTLGPLSVMLNPDQR
ncbi:MAG TPA: hypothetical protein VNH83_23630 [Bryobacteraceae bacterium]|nr:hypothetical protein [Bryobacteraceae bacterium]